MSAGESPYYVLKGKNKKALDYVRRNIVSSLVYGKAVCDAVDGRAIAGGAPAIIRYRERFGCQVC